jgi:serine phosphatase RsbU (regulator of sigma subunit)
MGILNTKTGQVLFANAGHNPPLVKHADGTYEYLKSRAGFVLAGMEGVRYRKNELTLAPGDAIYLYTDGVTEATNMSEELYGEERLKKVLDEHKDEAVEKICAEVKKDVDEFVGEAPQFDDITMLAIRYKGEE